jgi:protein AroM
MTKPHTKLGALVMGQSPRPDVEAMVHSIAGEDIELDLRGALDGLSRAEIDALPPLDDADTIFTRLPNGDGVRISKRAIITHGTNTLQALTDAGNDVTMILCTGDFPDWMERFNVVFPARALLASVRALRTSGRLGVFTPLAEQCRKSEARWNAAGYDASVVPLSPNADETEARHAAMTLQKHRPDLLVLDCMSYTRDTKRIARDVIGAPAILALSSAIRTALERA